MLAASSAPGQAEVPPRARIIVQSAILFAGSFSRGREWDLSGSQATHPVPLPRSKTPAEPTFLAYNGTVDAAPASVTTKASALLISGLPRGFSTCCLRFMSDVATAHARLASGWLAFTGRGSNPLGHDERFPSCYISSPFPGFILTLDGTEHDGRMECAGGSRTLPVPPLELGWRQVPERRMPTARIVEAFDELEDPKLTGEEQSGPITHQTTYTLSCTGKDGSVRTAEAIVNIIPRYEEVQCPTEYHVETNRCVAN